MSIRVHRIFSPDRLSPVTLRLLTNGFLVPPIFRGFSPNLVKFAVIAGQIEVYPCTGQRAADTLDGGIHPIIVLLQREMTSPPWAASPV